MTLIRTYWSWKEGPNRKRSKVIGRSNCQHGAKATSTSLAQL